MTDTQPHSPEHLEPPFPEGFPDAGYGENLLDLLESVMIQRAMSRGITDVALSDAQIPVDTAMSRDTLLPVLVDYTNHMLFEQSELLFDSQMMDALMVAAMNDPENPAVSSFEQAVADTAAVERHVKSSVQSPLFYNRESPQAALGFEVHMAKVRTIPVSVSLLLMDTALESAHQMSIQEQTATDGLSQSHILDLTYVTNYLGRLDVQNRVIAPAALHSRLEAMANSHAMPTEVAEKGQQEPSPNGAELQGGQQQ